MQEMVKISYTAGSAANVQLDCDDLMIRSDIRILTKMCKNGSYHNI